MDLRCPNGIKFAELVEPGVIEVKCRSERCGAGGGVVVLHRFDAMTGEHINTDRFAEPPRKENGAHGSQHHSAAVRSA
jgi:hypothetical protein